MTCCALVVFTGSVVVLTFFLSLLLYLFNFGSQLSAHNIARKKSGESEVNENDPSIYAMENNSMENRWREVEGCLQPSKLLDSNQSHSMRQFGNISETSSNQEEFDAVN